MPGRPPENGQLGGPSGSQPRRKAGERGRDTEQDLQADTAERGCSLPRPKEQECFQ